MSNQVWKTKEWTWPWRCIKCVAAWISPTSVSVHSTFSANVKIDIFKIKVFYFSLFLRFSLFLFKSIFSPFCFDKFIPVFLGPFCVFAMLSLFRASILYSVHRTSAGLSLWLLFLCTICHTSSLFFSNPKTISCSKG